MNLQSARLLVPVIRTACEYYEAEADGHLHVLPGNRIQCLSWQWWLETVDPQTVDPQSRLPECRPPEDLIRYLAHMKLDLYTIIHITYKPKRLMCGIYIYIYIHMYVFRSHTFRFNHSVSTMCSSSRTHITSQQLWARSVALSCGIGIGILTQKSNCSNLTHQLMATSRTILVSQI